MSTTPLVSVIMLSYNHERYIREALDSVLCQKTNFPFEIIIGDDASTDKTPEIIAEYAALHTNIIPILRKENIGATKNLTDLFKRCKSKYYAYLESDDSWCNPHKLQMQVAFLENHPEYNAILAWPNVINHKGQPLYHVRKFTFPRHTFTLFDFQMGKHPGQYSSALFRNVFPSLSFNWEELFDIDPLIGDAIMTLLLCHNGKIYVSHKPVSNYRFVESAASAQNFFSTTSTRNDLRLFTFRYYNNIENTYARLTGKQLNLRPRKFSNFISAIKEVPISQRVQRTYTMLKEEAHPIRLIIDGLITKKLYDRQYSTSHTDK
jgi:glycosyltransferase involved in cell wall biosynthesis